MPVTAASPKKEHNNQGHRGMEPDEGANDPRPDIADAAVAKLLVSLRAHRPPVFTDDETVALKEIALYWLGIGIAGKMLRHTSRIIRWAGYVVALYLAWKSGLLQQVLINRNLP